MKEKFIRLSTDNTTDKPDVLSISDFLKKNITEYAKEVCEDRALASYKDGLKPSQRRIIKALLDAGATDTKPTVKSAKIVGDTMGKYHPHGDSGIASALATLVNSKYPLVYGHGNWGSLTDGPASTRYTECRLSELGMKFVECSEISDLVPNYSGEYMEPVDFPTRVPNFFLNGCEGIAVGIACSIPEHNMGEIIDAFKIVIRKHGTATTDDIMKHIKGPDYKYGGKLLSSKEEVRQLYENGSGTLTYECSYGLSKQGTKTILTITEYCPGFSPSKFQDTMIGLMDSGDVLYANDCSTKTEPCKFEVVLKNESVFEEKIHKHIVCKKSYKFYALDRRKSDSQERDVDTRILEPNFVSLMNMWVDYRRQVETRMLDLEYGEEAERGYKCRLRLSALENLDKIKKSLESDNPDKFLEENLPILKKTPRLGNIVGSEYISELRLTSLRKIDSEKIRKELVSIEKEMERIDKDKSDIDSVLVRQLNLLRRFDCGRKLKA